MASRRAGKALGSAPSEKFVPRSRAHRPTSRRKSRTETWQHPARRLETGIAVVHGIPALRGARPRQNRFNAA